MASKHFADYFRAVTRARGAAYADEDRVELEKLEERAALLKVQGSEEYEVAFERTDGRLRVSCTCPVGDSFCKHMWAALVYLDGEVLLAPSNNRSLALELRSASAEAKSREPKSLKGITEGKSQPRLAPPAKWRKELQEISEASMVRLQQLHSWPAAREILYVVDAGETQARGRVALHVLMRDPRKDGVWGRSKPLRIAAEFVDQLPREDDRRIVTLLRGAAEGYSGGYDHLASGANHGGLFYVGEPVPTRYYMAEGQARELMSLLCATGRCRLRLVEFDDEAQWSTLCWDSGDAWRFELAIRTPDNAKEYELAGVLRRGGETRSLSEPIALLRKGLMITRSEVARYEHGDAFAWVHKLRKAGSLAVPKTDIEEFVAEMMQLPARPAIDLPQSLRFEAITAVPRPHLRLQRVRSSWEGDKLEGELTFLYEDVAVAHDEPRGAILRKAQRQLINRDAAAEANAKQQLLDAGLRHRPANGREPHATFTLAAKRMPAVVAQLLSAGWQVEAEGLLYREAGKFEVRVESGIDWFELHGEARFGELSVSLPELLAAMHKGESFVRLGDGSFGVLPVEWLQSLGTLAGTGVAKDGHVRFRRSQTMLLDALLARQRLVTCDAAFGRLRTELESFGGIASLAPPAGFTGELRPYQRESLGWFAFLRQYGFGGCLADDMGLGKTVQVLALLESRRELRAQLAQRGRAASRSAAKRVPPSLIVVPRSLVHNWMQEAARFTPQLRVLDHTGTQRQNDRDHFEQWDVVLTTYGTLRRDAPEIMDMQFDYVILDESQAIKNAGSDSSKAVRLLHAEYRLALSGTPVENHLGELWSLFEFLNPGMLGRAASFRALAANINSGSDDHRAIAHAVRPFLLRRTKQQVASDLPARVEQTLYCELDGPQRKRYEELRDYYRASLLQGIDAAGIKRAQMQIIEMLLRLRQAAIHPGLTDPKLQQEPSAKLDMLLPRLEEVVGEGHKVLVFSQFTQMLGILRARLDALGIAYEYLDGKTRDRQACVEHFQSDATCKIFLISLKAGGVGLNLTAAQYVFLLDPWWNPAVEAQAIDRAHRIGQTQHVFAYRLIARGTVEEKILELQTRKRGLADAIVNADNALIGQLSKDDLELLLS